MNVRHNELHDPDLFAADVHVCLLNDGLRSPRLRRLVRLSRNNAELERIFETKVAEFRRYLRESRVPSIWNLPIRGLEWLGDHFRFTAPREAVTTSLYVVLALVAFDVAKSKLPWSTFGGEHATRLASISFPRADEATVEYATYRPVTASEGPSKVDEWLVAELKRAARSADLQQVIAEQMQSSLFRAGNNDTIAGQKPGEQAVQEISASLDASRLTGQVADALREAVTRQNLDQLVADAIAQKLKTIDLKPVIEQIVSAGLKRQLADTVGDANASQREPASPESPVVPAPPALPEPAGGNP